VPSKSLIEASRSGQSFEEALAHVRSVVARIAATESAEVLRGEGVDVVAGRATFVDRRTIEVGGRRITGRRVVIATGSKAAAPPIDGLAATPYLTNESFFVPRSRPDRIVVIGAGAIGCELGEAMARFGCQVTLVEFAPRVLPLVEPDAATLVAEGLRGQGIDLRLDTGAQAVRHDGSIFTVDLGGEMLEADELLIATGRIPNTSGLGLEAIGVALDPRGFIRTDDWLRTTATHVYAVGDVNGKQLLSHAADEMGRIAVWTALRSGRRYRYDPQRIPQAVFTTPEVASIGVLECNAPDNARVVDIPMSANDRALAAGHPEGFVRMIARPAAISRHAAGGKLIGATIVGERAGELINECALIMRSNAYAGRLAQTVRAYPSWSTIMQKAAARWFYDIDGHGARPPRR
jgi:pyruvate/2-oxoglutarate dehydrogenase complex dihydrolipoamide dehydrogenase (E3) component